MSEKKDHSADSNGGSDGQLLPAKVGATVLARAPYGPELAYPNAAGSAREEDRDIVVDLLEYWHIFTKRKWLIASIILAALAIGTVRTLMMTPLYTATARIQIDRETPQILDKGNISVDDSNAYDFISTQTELLQSRAIAERVAVNLKLDRDTDFFAPTGTSITGAITGAARTLLSGSQSAEVATPSTAQQLRSAAYLIQSRISVSPIRGSRLVDIRYSDPKPSRAERIANAYVEAFIASTIDKRFEANAYAKTFLEDQIKQLKLRLEESEKTLLNFAQKEQIVSATDKTSISENNLAAANTTLGNLISERIKNENLWRQVENSDGINLPQLLTNTVIDGLRAKRNTLVTEYEEKLQTFKPDYPDMVQISNKIKEIDRQLAAEVETIKQSLKGAYESALAQENKMKARIDTLKTEVIDLQKRSVQYNILKREVDTNRDLYNGLLQRYKEVDVAGGVRANNVFIIERAEVPGSPSSPRVARALLIAFAAGLAVALVTAYVVEMIDETIHSPDELERTSTLATLGIIPLASKESTAETELQDPRSSLSEAYRSLCTSLQFATEAGLPKSLLITSSGPGEGKSLTSLAIARHFATMGLKVLLVDADLRNASLHKKMELDNTIGLTNYLTGACTPPDAFQATEIPNLAFLSSGPLPPNAADLLAGSRMVSLLTVGLEVFDLIVVDGPPVMGLADAAILSNTASATVFVVGAGQARIGSVRGALRRLQLARSPLIGTVLTKFNIKAAGYGYGYGYGYGSGYGYGYGYGHDPFTYGRPVDGPADDKPQLTVTKAWGK